MIIINGPLLVHRSADGNLIFCVFKKLKQITALQVLFTKYGGIDGLNGKS